MTVLRNLEELLTVRATGTAVMFVLPVRSRHLPQANQQGGSPAASPQSACW